MMKKNVNQITNNLRSYSDGSISQLFSRSFEENEQFSWLANSDIPTDLTIQVEDVSFYVHKYTLISRSEYISQINLQPSTSNTGNYDLKLENFPGGAETFEIVLTFCYGLPIELTPNNVASLRCASEYLQMTDEHEEGNLISKTEAYLTSVVVSSWKDTITVLKSCESLSPLPENLQIVRKCCDSIARMVYKDENSITQDSLYDEKWWVDDVSTLHIDHFVRVITGIRAKGLNPETLGYCIMKYAEIWLPSIDVKECFEGRKVFGFSGKSELMLSISSGRRREGSSLGGNADKRLMIESLVSILPPQREAVSCKFLLWMLKMAVVYSVTPALVSELEKRIGIVLEDANVVDLLIPSYRDALDHQEELEDSQTEVNTVYDIDMVHRIVEYFLMHEQQQQQQQKEQPPTSGILNVAKLLDGYLSEISRDPNLTISQFQVLLEILNENARNCHDGIYKAIDTYLKNHPDLSEHERRRLCKVMNCEKLSPDACMHAAQNERLPLRTVMQVMFMEQVKMRKAISEQEVISSERSTEQETILLSTEKEIEVLKAELDKFKMAMTELQDDYSSLQQEFEKHVITKQKPVSLGWSSGWKIIKNSTLFHRKMDDTSSTTMVEETPHRQVPNSEGRRRRMSIS